MTNKKRKAIKSPDHTGKTSKEAKMSDSTVSGDLVADTRGNFIFTKATNPDPCAWQGPDTIPPEFTPPKNLQPARQEASPKSKLVSTITHADIASIASWKPKPDSTPQTLPTAEPQPASQVSEHTERSPTNPPRKTPASTLEPILEVIPLSLPQSDSIKHEETSTKEELLVSISPITQSKHVEHPRTNPLTLSQILDKETFPTKHASTQVINNPLANLYSDLPSDLMMIKNIHMLMKDQKTMVEHIRILERKIIHLSEENKSLHANLNRLNATNNTWFQNLEQSISQLLETLTKNRKENQDHLNEIADFITLRAKETSTLNQQLNGTLKDSIKLVEEKIPSLETKIKSLVTSKSHDIPIQTSPQQQLRLPSSSPIPTPSPLPRQSS